MFTRYRGVALATAAILLAAGCNNSSPSPSVSPPSLDIPYGATVTLSTAITEIVTK